MSEYKGLIRKKDGMHEHITYYFRLWGGDCIDIYTELYNKYQYRKPCGRFSNPGLYRSILVEDPDAETSGYLKEIWSRDISDFIESIELIDKNGGNVKLCLMKE